MREHYHQLPLGNGDYSQKEAHRLITRLRLAITDVSGLQQGVQVNCEEYWLAHREIEDLIADLAAALLDSNVEITPIDHNMQVLKAVHYNRLEELANER